MTKRKETDCINTKVRLCGSAMRTVLALQGKELIKGNRISYERAISKLINMANEAHNITSDNTNEF